MDGSAVQQTRAENPYVGARSLNGDDRIYGRSREQALLYDMLITRRIVLLHAPSGAGKTSLIEAGLLNDLRVRGTFRPVQIRAGAPVEAPAELSAGRYLFNTLAALAREPNGPPVDAASLEGQDLGEYVAARYFGAEEDEDEDEDEAHRPRLLLIFDQFEEVLAAGVHDERSRRVFFVALGKLLLDRRVYALFALRDDYVGQFEAYSSYIYNGLNARIRLDLLNEQQAREAIVEPAKSSGVTYERRAIDALMEDLCRIGGDSPGRSTTVEPIQLQVACYRLWELTAPLVDAWISTLPEEFRVDTALRDFYDREVGRAADSAPESLIRAWFAESLISNGRRRQIGVETALKSGLDAKTLERLENSYLVRRTSQGMTVLYELSHDRLIEPVRQSNELWRKKLFFRDAAVAWHSNRLESWLLGPDQMLRAFAAIEGTAQIDQIDRDFVTASRLRLSRQMTPRLAEQGWGIIFPNFPSDSEFDGQRRHYVQVWQQLEPLRVHRMSQAAGRLHIYGAPAPADDEDGASAAAWPLGYRVNPDEPHQTVSDFLRRLDETALPHYLLLIGGPEHIPFEFQYELSVGHAVGRLAFPTPDEYGHYARALVALERADERVQPHLGIFVPEQRAAHQARAEDGDAEDTEPVVVARHIAPPLRAVAAALAAVAGARHRSWELEEMVDANAVARGLADLLARPPERRPSLLFATAAGFPADDGPKSKPDPLRGALLGSGWDGQLPSARNGQPIAPEPPAALRRLMFAADDLPADADLSGMVVVLAASYSAGMSPREEDNPDSVGLAQGGPRTPAVARLAQSLLGRDRPALAVVGRVDLCGRQEEELKPQFQELFTRLLVGQPVGAAMEPFGRSYGELSTRVLGRLLAEDQGPGEAGDLAILWSTVSFYLGRSLEEQQVSSLVLRAFDKYLASSHSTDGPSGRLELLDELRRELPIAQEAAMRDAVLAELQRLLRQREVERRQQLGANLSLLIAARNYILFGDPAARLLLYGERSWKGAAPTPLGTPSEP